jgi:hypothetical protein
MHIEKSAKQIKRHYFMGVYNGKKSPKINSNAANNFSSDVG